MLKFDLNALFVLINLIVFFLLMKKFLFGRIAKVIEERQNIVDKQFQDAAAVSQAADEKLADYESKIANVQAEGEQIVADAKDSAKAEYNKIIERAEVDANQIKADARTQMNLEAENARKQAREEIASLAMEAAKKIVGANVSAETDSAIFDDFLNEGSNE